MSDPNMDEAAAPAGGTDQGTTGPDSVLNMGTVLAGGPLRGEPGPSAADSDGDIPEGDVIDPDTGQPVGGAGAP